MNEFEEYIIINKVIILYDKYHLTIEIPIGNYFIKII